MSRRAISFTAIALLAVGFGAMLMHPPTVIFGVFLAYLASGYVVWLWRLFRKPQGVTEVAATGAEEKIGLCGSGRQALTGHEELTGDLMVKLH